MGELGETELAELIPIWRGQYERRLEPGFAYCIGHAQPSDTFGTWIEGAGARKAYYEWAGIPRTLLRQWGTERLERERIEHAAGI